MVDTYKKNRGYANAEGVKFQLDVVIVSSLNALLKHENWKISSENKGAGKFDDVVIELPDGVSILIQTKHKKSEIINKNKFLSVKRNADFGLPKYFFSYEEIKRDSEKKVVICTNANIDVVNLVDILNVHSITADNVLQCEDSDYSFYTFNENFLPELKERVEIYYEKHLQDGDTDKAVITDENLKDFLKNLQIFSSYPSGVPLQKVIEELLSHFNNINLCCNISYHEIYWKMEDWLKQRVGEFLTNTRAKAMLCEIRCDKYCDILKSYNISFEQNEFNLNKTQVVHITTEQGYFMPLLKVYHALKDQKSKKLFMISDDDTEVQNQTIETFRRHNYSFLVLILIKTTYEYLWKVVSDLKEILQKDLYKKVVLITENKLPLKIELEDVSQIDESVTLDDLSKDSQERLLKARHLVFQGENISLEELLEEETFEVTKSLHSGILEKLVRKEEIKIGKRLLDLNEEIARCYIPRIFERTGAKKDTFHEENLFDAREKVILISHSAGTGKSTVLTKIAANIKLNNPRSWVIRINLNDYSKVLKDYLRANKTSISLLELLDSKQVTKMTSQFENFVISMHRKVVLMLDGVDEIVPDYTGLIVDLIKQCQEAPNLKKIFITTRPHMCLELESVLKVKSFTMLPFTKEDQVNFLVNYWTHNLHLNYTNEHKCRHYAETLIDKTSLWIQSYHYWDSTFTTIPLQVGMLGKIFQENNSWNLSTDWEGCKEYLEGDNMEPKLPNKLNIVKLYETFIGNKQSVFLSKENPNGNAATNTALLKQFEECLIHHQSLALKTILSERESELFTSYQTSDDMKEYMLKIGIVQQLGDEFQFIHRTFAEYFVAESIVKELKRQYPHAEFLKFIIDDVLVHDRFEVVCAFVDILLQTTSLPSDTFRNYRFLICKSNFHLIYDIARKGYAAILQHILNSIHFRVVQRQKINIDDWRVRVTLKKRNTLNDLKLLLHVAGLNIKNKYGDTPLHYAVMGGHLDMVKFLVERGADNHIRNKNGSAASHLAAELGMLDIVRYLSEHSTDININAIKDGLGRTALHLAAKRNRLDTIDYLVESGAMLNIKDNEGYTALHLAAKWGQYGTVKYLVSRGANVKAKDKEGNTALHLAVQWGHSKIIEHLVEHDDVVNVKNNSGCTPLHLAAKWRNWNVVKYLVEHKAVVDVRDGKGCTPLHLAVEWDGWYIAEYLVENGASVNSKDMRGWMPLHSAASHNCINSVKYLVEQGALINDRDLRGCTPLHVAAKGMDWNIVKYLVEHGAVMDVIDDRGWTPLHSAAYKNQSCNVKFLVESGMCVNCKDTKGRTPLHLSAEYGDVNTVHVLLSCEALVNVKDDKGRTPLHIAVKKHNTNIVKYLTDMNRSRYRKIY